MNSLDSAKILGQVLADTYVLLVKTQNVHWNVSGRSFVGIHTLSEQQYNELFAAIDVIAERIRALGQTAPGSLAEFSKLARIGDGMTARTDDEMAGALLKANRAMSASLREAVESTGELGDDATQDLLIERLNAHDKAAWMWGAFLNETAPVKQTALDEVKQTSAEPKKKSAVKPKKSTAGETAVEEAKEQVAKEPKASTKSESSKSSKPKDESDRDSGRRRLFSGSRVSG